MTVAYRARDGVAERFPSVVHVDGSVRPQTVTRDVNPRFADTIDAFGNLTGHPMVLNTSFNVRGEPIIRSPQEAIRCFFGTGLDAMAIGNYWLEKPDPRPRR
jgi:carbamoyltransferase